MRSFMISTSHQIIFGDQIKEDEMSEARSMYGEKRNAYQVLVGKPEGKEAIQEM